jgi:hypothetical protein
MAGKDFQKMAERYFKTGGKSLFKWPGKSLNRGREGVVKMSERRRSGVDSGAPLGDRKELLQATISVLGKSAHRSLHQNRDDASKKIP